jgi:hypothetical protein
MGYSTWGPSQNSLMPQKTHMFSLSLNPLPAPQEAKQGGTLTSWVIKLHWHIAHVAASRLTWGTTSLRNYRR